MKLPVIYFDGIKKKKVIDASLSPENALMVLQPFLVLIQIENGKLIVC